MAAELWVVSRTEGDIIWTAPVYVRWEYAMARFCLATPLKAQHHQAYEDFIKKTADYRPVHGWWEVPRRVFQVYARKIEDDRDPKNYVTYRRLGKAADQAESMAERPTKDIENSERHQFIARMVEKGLAKDFETAYQWYMTICQHAADELINHERPVDMFFIKLHISPYRQNWMLEMLKKFPNLGKVLKSCSGEKAELLLHDNGVYEFLLNHEMLAMPHEGVHCYRHIEVEHKRTWWRETVRAERVRYAQLGPVKYASYFMDSVRRRLKVSVKLYRQWLAAVSRPQAQIVRGDDAGRPRFIPATRAHPHYFRPSRFVELPPVVALELPKWDADRVQKALPAPNGSVPALPDIQSPPQDVRDGNGNAGISGPVNGKEGDDRVWVSNVPEGVNVNDVLGEGQKS